MLNFTIKTPKKQLHQSFQIVKVLAYFFSHVGWWFVCSCFIIILMSSLYYLNEMVKNIEFFMFDAF